MNAVIEMSSAQDGEDLSELSDKMKLTIAECFHQLYAGDVRERLIKKTEERMQDLKTRKK